MPSPLIKAYAEQAGVPQEKVEKYWKWAKEEASKKFKKKSSSYWAYVNKLTEIRLGLKKIGESTSFKSFLGLLIDK